jgi:hypothetical protein
MEDHAANGQLLSCTNAACGCRLRVDAPCPHGDTYTCACGHPLTSAVEPNPDSVVTPGA